MVVSLWQHTVSAQQYQQSTVLRQYVTQYQQSTGGSWERERELSVSRESISREYTQHRDHTAYRESQQNEWLQREHSMLKLVQPFHLSDILHREDQCDVSTELQLHSKSALLRYTAAVTHRLDILSHYDHISIISKMDIISYHIIRYPFNIKISITHHNTFPYLLVVLLHLSCIYVFISLSHLPPPHGHMGAMIK